jgi:uncharacterized YceG family protein
MSPSRRGDSGGSRSAEQRERDRRERERRRARRDGTPTGGSASGSEPFDILASDFDPTISRPPDLDFDPTVSRPPDLDWPIDVPAIASGLDPGLSRQPDVSWPLEVPPPARHSPDDLLDPGYRPSAPHAEPDAGYRQPAPHDEPDAGYHQPAPHDDPDPAYDEPAPHDGPDPGHDRPVPPGKPSRRSPNGRSAQRGTYRRRLPEQAPAAFEPTAHGDPHAVHESTDFTPHPGYQPPEGYSADLGPDDAAAGARRGLAGRLPPLRPSLPGNLGGRLAGLRGARTPADDEPAPGRRRLPAPRVGRRLPEAGAGPETRVGSLRRSLDRQAPRRSKMSDATPTTRRIGPRGRTGAIAALVVVLIVLWFLVSLFQPLKGNGSGQVDVVIPAGAGTSAIGTLLAKDHVISSAFFFKLRAALSGKRGKLESGRYTLRRGMSYGAALAALTSTSGQPTVTLKVTIPEGDTRLEIAAIAKKAGVVGDYYAASAHSHVLKPTTYGAPKSVHSLEGFLFPDTYDFLPGDKASTLINDQLAAFKQNLAKVDLTAAKRVHLTAYDVVTIASMVEREAEVPRERPLIAAVIYNRLRAGMSLGIDATLRYALNDFDHPLTDSQLASRSPYNTRIHKGLPPTPIGNPGLASLQAAAHPAKVSYLYYVVKPGTCGQDAFSTTFAQFEADSARYNAARNADNGRSPTTCSG